MCSSIPADLLVTSASTPGRQHDSPIAEQRPIGPLVALKALTRCLASTGWLLARRRIHLPKGQNGMRLRFADGTSAPVFRETVIDCGATQDPCLLVVEFRLRAIRGWGHAAFRRESLLNTPLFAGFSGLVSKLWLANDELGRYRGIYEWDGPRAPKPTPAPCGECSRWCGCRAQCALRAARAAPRRPAQPARVELHPADKAETIDRGVRNDG